MDGESSRSHNRRLDIILQDRSSELQSLPLEYLREITNNFSDERLLGKGGFGIVYKGVVQNEDMVAVKKLTLTIPGAQDKQFENEVRHLMGLKHPNIVQLLGYCCETEIIPLMHDGKFVYAEKSERLLCLEYLSKGSLREHLSDETFGLNWDTRYKIIEGICYGLHYLHKEWKANTPIIHMDLKPPNILLDDNMVPKIADFGLSRLFGEEQTRTCTASRQGTLGYMAPEYLNRGIITKKVDIFSLGVIIIEIMTGSKDYPFETETSSQKFVELVVKNWKNRLEKAPGFASREIYFQQIRRCIEIGLACVKLDWEERPTTCQIIKMLRGSEGPECSTEREIPEELTILGSKLNHVPGGSIEQDLPPTYKLSFMNTVSDVIFTKREVRAGDDNQIKIRMLVCNHQGGNCPQVLSANVKVVVLHGDFNANRIMWTPEEFENHIVRPRDKVGAVLRGKLNIKLENGEAYLHGVTFIDNSSFVRSRKFRLGVKLIDDVGLRVQEGITEPFTVKEQRREGYRKRGIPRLDDEVCYLQKIEKGSILHESLKCVGILLVKDFLRQYYKDAEALRNILSRASLSVWTTILCHALKCRPGRALYSYFMEDKKIRLYFSSLGQIVGATIAGQYNAFVYLDMPLKARIREWSKDAYHCIVYEQPDYEMYKGQPRPINSDGLLISQKTREDFNALIFPDQSTPEGDEQDNSEDGQFSGSHSGQSIFKNTRSKRLRDLLSAHENNEALDSGPQIQYETPDANYNAGCSPDHSPEQQAVSKRRRLMNLL